MASKKFKYSHLYSVTSGNTPTVGQMIPGEIALNLHSGFTHMWASDGTQVIDLGKKLGGGKGDELTIHSEVIDGERQLSTIIYMKDVTAEFDGSTPAKTLPANVKKRYALVNADGENIMLASGVTPSVTADTDSAYIDIYKDSSIVEVYVGTQWDSVNATTGVIDKKQIGDEVTGGHIVDEKDFQYLNYVYFSGGYSGSTISGDSEYKMTKVDLTKFLVEKEFASGVTANAEGIVTGVVDSSSDLIITAWTAGDYDSAGATAATESGLTVGEDGFKLQNIQKAIDAKHANTILISGYSSSAGTEEIFDIQNGDTIAKALMKIENKLESNGTGVAAGGGIEVNNTGIVFIENGENTVLLGAGTY